MRECDGVDAHVPQSRRAQEFRETRAVGEPVHRRSRGQYARRADIEPPERFVKNPVDTVVRKSIPPRQRDDAVRHQHAPELGDHALRVRKMSHAERAHDCVERAVGKRQLVSARLAEVEAGIELARQFNHGRCNVGADGARAALGRFAREAAGARRHVQQPRARPDVRGIE